ncbi:MAG: hypothetical protein M3404_02090, partial [Actinomycetota bacterium]|nr:hypothetical protein [Actinomycetota bacterium]
PGVVLPRELKPVHELGLMLTWERAWRRSSYYADYERLLHEQLRSRALPPLREHLGFWRKHSGARMLSSAEVRVLRPGQSPSMAGTMDAVRVRATAALGVSWVLRVWGRGLALVGGAFVLDVTDEVPADPALRVRAVRWEERGSGTWAPRAAPALVATDQEGELSLVWVDEA